MTPRAFLIVAEWSVAQLLLTGRTLGMAALAATPILVALGHRTAIAFELAEPSSGLRTYSILTATLTVPLIVPLLSLFYASGIVSDDEEAGTLRYYLTRPVPRSDLALGKMLGNYVMTAVLFLPSLVLTFYVSASGGGLGEIGRLFPVLLQSGAAVLLALFAYNGLFSLMGTMLKRPLLVGLFFVFVWQTGAAVVPGTARYLTVTHYLHSLLPRGTFAGTLQALAGRHSSSLAAVAALVAVGFASHAAAAYWFSRKEL